MMEKHRSSAYTSGHWVKASVVDPTRTSLIDVIGTEREKPLYIPKAGLFRKWSRECGYHAGWLLTETMELGAGVITLTTGVYTINLEKEQTKVKNKASD